MLQVPVTVEKAKVKKPIGKRKASTTENNREDENDDGDIESIKASMMEHLNSLASWEEILSSDSIGKPEKKEVMKQFKDQEKAMSELISRLRGKLRKVLDHEGCNRVYHGMHEDIVSHPEYFTEDEDISDRRITMLTFMMAFMKDHLWQKRFPFRWEERGGEDATTVKNIKSRVATFLVTIKEIKEKLVKATTRSARLEKSKSRNKELATFLKKECDQVLDRQDFLAQQMRDAQAELDAGPAWKLTEEEKGDGQGNDPETSLPTSSGPALYDTQTLPPLPQSAFEQRGPSGEVPPTGGNRTVPQMALMSSFKLTVLDSLMPAAVRSFVNEASQAIGHVGPDLVQQYLTKEVIACLNVLEGIDARWTGWKGWGKDQLVTALEENILRGKSYEQSFEELLGKILLLLDPKCLTTAAIVEAWKELFELLRRYEEHFHKAEHNKETWKKLWPLCVKLVRTGRIGPGAGPDVSRTAHLRNNVATTMQKRCLKKDTEDGCITTVKGFFEETIKEFVTIAETFDSKNLVFMELSQSRGAQGEVNTNKKPRLDPTPTGGAGQAQGGKAGGTAPRPAGGWPVCNYPGCGKRHQPPHRPVNPSGNPMGKAQLKQMTESTDTVTLESLGLNAEQLRYMKDFQAGLTQTSSPKWNKKDKGKRKSGYNSNTYKPPGEKKG